MSEVVLSHHQSTPGDHIFVRIFQKFAGVFDTTEHVRGEEAAKLSQLWQVTGVANCKLDPTSVLK